MKISKLVITGGPCAGKSTAQSWIEVNFTKLGYRVLFVAETATELITSGLTPWGMPSNADFQHALISLQMQKERVYQQAAAELGADKVLIVCDRGIMDNRAYMGDEEYRQLLERLGKSEVELRDGYDAVFHLVTAANGAEDFYTLSNNQARTETIEQARALDQKLIAAWTGHPHLRVIDNSTPFERKLERLMAEMRAFLGEPEPLEIERKFLIARPDEALLLSQPSCTRVEIVQSYLTPKPGFDEDRIRERGADGSYIYTRTQKRRLDRGTRVEVEQRISEREYLRLLMDADPDLRPVRKTRYCLMHGYQYFEIDIYPFMDSQAILEIELESADQQVTLPPFINPIREVTGERAFENRALAERR